MCDKHYRRWRKHGDPTVVKQVGPKRLPFSNRLNKKIDKDGPVMPGMDDECWIWTGALTYDGYGKIGRGGRGQGRTVLAHRALWELETGETLTQDDQICHRCDNPRCLRLSHLFKGTLQENMQDCLDKGRFHVDGPNRKFSDEDVRYMRTSGDSTEELVEKFDINQAYLYKIQIGAARKDSA